jgi:hypothetical protein
LYMYSVLTIYFFFFWRILINAKFIDDRNETR